MSTPSARQTWQSSSILRKIWFSKRPGMDQISAEVSSSPGAWFPDMWRGWDYTKSPYRPLPDGYVRLVMLLPASVVAPLGPELTVTIEIIDLDKIEELRAEYIAISYTWGTSHRTVPIYAYTRGGHRHKLLLTHSAVDLLSYLRHETKPRWFWIDQLCVNQEDDGEKASQIPKIGRIFEKATNIYVWLGLASDDSDLAMDRLIEMRELCEEMAKSCEGSIENAFWAKTNDGVTRRLKHGVFDTLLGSPTKANLEAWNAIGSLIQRPWFERIWILQEATALHMFDVKMICGNKECNFSAMSLAYHVVSDLLEYCYQGEKVEYRPMLDAMKFRYRYLGQLFLYNYSFKKTGQREDMLSLLYYTGRYKATDPRDKVYSLIGCARDNLDAMEPIIVDMTKSVRSVFTDFILWHLRRHGNLDALGLCSIRQNIESGFPSWVPDFSLCVAGGRPMMLGTLRDWEPLIKASNEFVGRLTPSPSRSLQPNSLALSGIRIGPIDITAAFSKLFDHSFLNMLKSKANFNGTTLLQMLLDAATLLDTPKRLIPTVEEIEAVVRQLNEDGMCSTSGPGERLTRSLYSAVPEWAVHRIFAVGWNLPNASSIAGLGPENTITTDRPLELWLLKGGKTLYILAPKSDSQPIDLTVVDTADGTNEVRTIDANQTMYQLVGEACVSGMMHGEVLEYLRMKPEERPGYLQDMSNDFETVYLV